MLDTAGRLHVDQALMDEMKAVADIATPHEILLVVDCADRPGRGQRRAAASRRQVPLTGVVLTRMDGDARGGAALSMRAVTGKPIKFAGTGEKLDALEPFHPSASPAASSAWATSSAWSSAPPRRSRRKTPSAMAAQAGQGPVRHERPAHASSAQMRRMGGLGALAGMIPGMKKAQAAMASGAVDDKMLLHMDAMIGSMTPKERAKPELLNAKRKIRIAKGSRHDGAGRQQAAQDAPGNVRPR